MKSQELNWALMGVGAACVNLALYLGIGFDLGWWGLLFWTGLGVLLAAFINEVRRP